MRGTLFRGPHNKDYDIFVNWGPPDFGKLRSLHVLLTYAGVELRLWNFQAHSSSYVNHTARANHAHPQNAEVFAGVLGGSGGLRE